MRRPYQTGGAAVFTLCLIFGMASPAWAAKSCYTPEELRAEQLLRLHSELMVITVSCRQNSSGQNLVPAYTGFTHDNINTLQSAEQTLIRYFNNNGKGSGVSLLDKMRTKLGNEFGQKMANMSSPAFCLQYRDKVTTFSSASPMQIEDEVKAMTASEKSYVKLCPSGESHVAKDSR